MKNKHSKAIFGVCIVMAAGLCASPTSAAIVYSTNFDTYTNGNLATQDNWVAYSSAGSSPIQVNNGKVVIAKVAGEDDSHVAAFDGTAGTSAYFGLDINLSAATSGGAYFAGFLQTSTAIGGRLFAKSTTNGYLLGTSSNNGTIVYGTGVETFGSVVHVVLRYDFVSGATNDVSTIYVAPTSATEGSNAVYATQTGPGASTSDLSSIASFIFRQDTASTTPTLTADNLVVSSDFASASAVPEPAALAAVGLTGIGLLKRRRHMAGV